MTQKNVVQSVCYPLGLGLTWHDLRVGEELFYS